MWCLHSKLSPAKRKVVIDAFLNEEFKREYGNPQNTDRILFCTDVAAVSLDLGCIDVIVQVGLACPNYADCHIVMYYQPMHM